MHRHLPYRIDGVHSVIGNVMTMDEWAQFARIPNRKTEGILEGREISKILGIHSKSWDTTRFRDDTLVARVATAALDCAAMRPGDVDAAIVITCTPYETMLDQDSFRILREVGIADHVVPIQLGAGCAGLARAMAIAARLDAQNVLIIAYNVPSLYSEDRTTGCLSDRYRDNRDHPFHQVLWMSPAIFSDAAAAMVLRRSAASNGFVLYSRDAQNFGDNPGFTDPLIHYLGGGAKRPALTEDGAATSVYAMAGDQVKRYYTEGMLLNHRSLEEARPGYVSQVKRIYTHQASPALIADFTQRAELPTEKTPSNAAKLGNLVTPCTMQLFHEDALKGAVSAQDHVCFSVVGAGPERGAFIVPVGAFSTLAMSNE